jgi:hypothetical protein
MVVYKTGDVSKILFIPPLSVSPFWAVKFMVITGFPTFHKFWTVRNGQVAAVPMLMMVTIYFVTSTERCSVADRTIVSEDTSFFSSARS